MELGNRLVKERGYLPSVRQQTKSVTGVRYTSSMERVVRSQPNSTEELVRFTEWLNQHPEAQEILGELGLQWPVKNSSSET